MMKNYTKALLFVLGGLLLIGSAAGTAQAQRFPYGGRERPTYVSGSIRWKKDLGIIPMGPGNKQAAPVPCGQFFVAGTEPASGKSIAYTTNPFAFSEEGDYYVCRYAMKAPANKTMYMIPGMGGVLLLPKMDTSAFYWTDPWIGGNRNKPPAGAFRTFTGFTYVTLSTRRPRGVANFEMIYGRSDDPR
ncbi:MAG: hypothetical protein ABIP75_14540 [Pyrinomonadaceae bacterium]